MILLRHGQSEFNVHFSATGRDPGVRDAPLTELGRRQAAAAATRLAGRVSRLVASPYTRALQTATIIAELLSLAPPEVTPLCGEYALFSCDVGTPRSELTLTWPQLDLSGLNELWWPTESETASRVDRRAREFRAVMAAQADHDDVAVISHWGFIRALTGEELENGAFVVCTP